MDRGIRLSAYAFAVWSILAAGVVRADAPTSSPASARPSADEIIELTPSDSTDVAELPSTFAAPLKDLTVGADQKASVAPPPAADAKRVVESQVEASPTLNEPCQCECVTDFTLRDDIRAFPREYWDDVKSTVNLHSVIVIGEGIALAAVSRNNWDADVRQYTLEHPDRWGKGFSDTFDVLGHPATQLGAAGAIYAASLLNDDPKLHDFSKALLNSLIMTDLGVVALKYSFNSDRPNGDPNGFPSGHTASSFAAAAVVDEYYGGLAGLGAYTIAGLVAWQRIDSRSHNLSDVLFGAAFGYAIGKSVAFNHLKKSTGWEIFPIVDIHTGTSLMFRRVF